jgi:basic membrane protein A
VVTMHVDSPATIVQTVEARGAMSIGFQSVEARVLAPKGWITGLGFTWTRYFKDVANDVLKNQFASSATYRGLGHMLALAPFGDAVPEDVRKQVTETAAKIQDGWNPFTGPITDNEGKVRIAAGESWGGDKMGNFDWYVEGVVGKVK